MEEVTDEPLYRDRVCGIEIGKAGMVATIARLRLLQDHLEASWLS